MGERLLQRLVFCLINLFKESLGCTRLSCLSGSMGEASRILHSKFRGISYHTIIIPSYGTIRQRTGPVLKMGTFWSGGTFKGGAFQRGALMGRRAPNQITIVMEIHIKQVIDKMTYNNFRLLRPLKAFPSICLIELLCRNLKQEKRTIKQVSTTL